jgi:hypothetical protein
VSPGLHEEHQLWKRVMAAMNDFVVHLSRAQRISRHKAPIWSLRSVRTEYDHWMHRKHDTKAALNQLRIFVRLADEYRAVAGTDGNKQWVKHDEQKLRKPLARLKRLEVESQKWEGMRRLLDKQKPLAFYPASSGRMVKLYGHVNPFDASTWFAERSP